MKRLFWSITIAIFAIPLFAQIPVKEYPDQEKLLLSNNPQLAANKKLVYDFWIKVFQTRDMKLAPQYMAENYIQHNPNVPTGRKAFMEFFGQFEQVPVKSKIDDLVNILAEGDMVVLAFKRELPDPQKTRNTYTTTWFDMFRIENGKIAEHWDYGTKSNN